MPRPPRAAEWRRRSPPCTHRATGRSRHRVASTPDATPAISDDQFALCRSASRRTKSSDSSGVIERSSRPVAAPSTKSITKNGWPSTAPVGSSHRTRATGQPRAWAAPIMRNSSPLDDPNTPPCSTRTTYPRRRRSRRTSSARELRAIRFSATTATSPSCSSWAPSHRCNGADRLIHRACPERRRRAVQSRPARRRVGARARHGSPPARLGRRQVVATGRLRQHHTCGLHHRPLRQVAVPRRRDELIAGECGQHVGQLGDPSRGPVRSASRRVLGVSPTSWRAAARAQSASSRKAGSSTSRTVTATAR